MASRPQPLRPVMLEPVAAPVDTFVKPQKVEQSPLWEVAQSLKGLEKNLDGLMAQRQQEQSESDKAAGEAAFYQNNKTGYAEGVKQGLIPAFASPSFVQAYKAAEGNLLGIQLATKFKTAYDSWEGKNSSDPNAFTGFYTDFLRQNVPQSTDPAVLKGLVPHLRNLTQGGQSAFDQDRHKNMYNGSLRTNAALGKQATDTALAEGKLSGKGADLETLYGHLMVLRQNQTAAGTKEEDADKQFVDGVTTSALEIARDDPKEARRILSLLDRSAPGKAYKWSEAPYGRDEKLKAASQVDTIYKQAQRDAEHAQDRADRKTIIANKGEGIDFVISHPHGTAIPEELLARGQRLDPNFRAEMFAFQKMHAETSVMEDPVAKAEVYKAIQAGGGPQAAHNAIQKGIFRTPESVKAVKDFADNYEERYKRFTEGPIAEQLNSAAASRTNTSKNDPATSIFGGTHGLSNAAIKAQEDFRFGMYEWALKNPNASRFEIEQQQAKVRDGILGGLPPQAEPQDRYVRSQSEVFGGGTSPRPRSEVPPAQPQGQSAITPEQRQQYLASLPPEKRATLEAAAKAQNKPLDAAVDALIRRQGTQHGAPPGAEPEGPILDPNSYAGRFIEWLRSSADGQPSGREAARAAVKGAINAPADFSEFLQDPNSPRPPANQPSGLDALGKAFPGVGKFLGISDAKASTTKQPTANPFADAIRAAFKANPALAKTGDAHTDRLLGFIANLEAPRGYNQMFGEKEPTTNLVGMTLDQVLSLQGERKASGVKSTAAGRYQFMRDTLRDLKSELGLSGTEQFNEQFQDRLAQALLERRGYTAWKEGRLSTEQFANNLAKEWAALPRVDTGRSHYDGDGLNRSLTTPGQVLATLGSPEAARSAGPAASAPTQGGVLAGKYGPADVYANIPEKDSRGEDQIKKFLEWNPDPVGNHETNLRSIKPQLQTVFEKAQKDNPGLRIVVGAGVRSQQDQEKAVKWGWSKTLDSHHADGSAMDVWVLDQNGRVTFDEKQLSSVGAALKKAASELGVKIRWGGDFKSFKDRPHFELG